MLLDVKNLDISYGSKLTVSGVNIQLDKGEILAAKQPLSVPLWAACPAEGMFRAAA